MVPSHRKVRSGRDEFREPSPASRCAADGNPEPSRRYTAGRCRDYLSASVALNDRLERPAPHRGEEIVHSLRKRWGNVNPLVLGSSPSGPKFHNTRARAAPRWLRPYAGTTRCDYFLAPGRAPAWAHRKSQRVTLVVACAKAGVRHGAVGEGQILSSCCRFPAVHHSITEQAKPRVLAIPKQCIIGR